MKNTDDKKNKKKRNSSYFGFACKRSFDLKDRLDNNMLILDDMLAETYHLDKDGNQVLDSNGSLALKMFIKHLDENAIRKMSRIVVKDMDRMKYYLDLSKDNEILKRKLKLLSTFS